MLEKYAFRLNFISKQLTRLKFMPIFLKEMGKTVEFKKS